MSERFLSPLIKYTTSTLKTLPGAKLYFYRANTTTPAVVYQDVGLITPHAHPVVASSDGTFPEIFLNGAYNVLLTNTDDVAQPGWPIDYVGGNQSGFSFDLWNPALNYGVGDLVTHTNGLRYQSLQTPNINREPDDEPTYWREVRFFLDWSAINIYNTSDRVLHSGRWYISRDDDNQNHTPASSSEWWSLITESYEWNNDIDYGVGDYVNRGNLRFISKVTPNLNQDPLTDTAEAYWKPDWQAIDSLVKVTLKTGGGTLTPYIDNVIIDDGTYTLPAANSVPAGAWLIASKPDTHRANDPIVQRAGADNITWVLGNDTSVTYNLPVVTSIRYVSNGTDEWMI